MASHHRTGMRARRILLWHDAPEHWGQLTEELSGESLLLVAWRTTGRGWIYAIVDPGMDGGTRLAGARVVYQRDHGCPWDLYYALRDWDAAQRRALLARVGSFSLASRLWPEFERHLLDPLRRAVLVHAPLPERLTRNADLQAQEVVAS